jgi:signal peptidase I
MGRPRRLFPRLAAVAISAAIATLAIPALVPLLLRRRLTRVEVAGESMTPALLPGDFLVVRRGAPRLDHAYGQIVATTDPRPEGESRLLLKRVVGLPGESLRVGGGVLVNGRRLDEPYAHGDDPIAQHRGVQRLAEDTCFVLGDNRAASTDSRDFGPVHRSRIEGVAILRYWPPSRMGWLRPPARRFQDAPAEPPQDAGAPHPHEH